MDAIYDTYIYIRTVLQSSKTIERELGGPVKLLIYGSAANGLFDVQQSQMSGWEQSDDVQEMQSDLDLTLIIDEVAAKRKNKFKTHQEILMMIANKFKHEKNTSLSQNNTCQIKKIIEPYTMSAGALLEI